MILGTRLMSNVDGAFLPFDPARYLKCVEAKQNHAGYQEAAGNVQVTLQVTALYAFTGETRS